MAGLIMGFLVHGFGQWLPKMLENGGISAQSAGFMASIVSVAGIPSTLILPRAVPRRLIGRFLALFPVLASAGILISAATSFWVVAGLILYGIAVAVLFPLLTVVLMDDPRVGPRSMGVAGAILFAFVQVGGSTGPMLMSITVGATGSFLRGIWVLAAAGLLLAALTFALRESKREPSVAPGAET